MISEITIVAIYWYI